MAKPNSAAVKNAVKAAQTAAKKFIAVAGTIVWED